MSKVNPGVKLRMLEACQYSCAVCQASALPRIFKDNQGYRIFDENGQMTNKAITVDHIVPKAKGGTNRQINLIVMCSRCNSEKTDKDPMEWLHSLNAETQKRLKKPVITAISFHQESIGKNICDVCTRDLAKKTKKDPYSKNYFRRTRSLIKKLQFGNWLIKLVGFALLVIPSTIFRYFLMVIGQWEKYVSISKKD
jgi:hypothetical protein